MTQEQRRDFLAFSYLRNKEAREVILLPTSIKSLGRTGKKRLVNV
jgi:hypothetical protein